MSTKYRFSINGWNVSPIYKDDISKDYELESQQRFYRAKLSGSLVFIKDDYEWIKSQPFATKFVLLIERYLNGVWSNYLEGVFYKTDGKWNEDDKSVTVKVDGYDQYTEILAGIENEYDLIKLAPAKTPLQIQKRPLIQLYIPGDSVVSCFLGGNYWEQDTAFEVTDTSDLINTYYFAKASTLHKIYVSGTGLPQDCVGDYVTEGELLAENTAVFYGRNNVFKIEYTPGSTNPGGYPFTLKIIRVSDSEEMFTYSGNTDQDNLPLDTDFELTAVSIEASGTLNAIWTQIEVYMRYLLDVETIAGLNTYLIPTDDIVSNNRNYHRAIGYAIDQITITASASLAPTEYGLMDDGQYFQEPYSIFGDKFFPVARSTWGYSSIWFNFDLFDYILEEQGRKAYTMKDSMLISDVIAALLAEIDPTISHEGTSDYSKFLYGATNPITFGAFKVMLTQKSNILAGEYDRPAQKAPATLSSIMAMLRDTMKLYWYIEDNKFKIEHVEWFKNGGSYSSSSILTADLTALTNRRNAKKWGLYSSNYEYDKQNLAERIEFAWMDDVTAGFEGYPIEINSKFVQRGKKDSISVSEYTTDIDYMLLNPEAINQDGFALFAATYNDTDQIYELPFIERTMDDADLRLQNGLMSWIYLHPNFWTYDLPASYVTINEDPATVVYGIERKKKQKVNYPSIEDPDPYKLVKTYLGNGQIDKLSINLSSRMNEIQLKYDTE
jgi:hypothetical protein